MTRFPLCCYWICNEVVQITDRVFFSITRWTAGTHSCTSCYLSYRKEEQTMPANINFTKRRVIKNWKMVSLCSPESSVPVSLLGNTDPFTHPLKPTSNPYEVWPRTASWCRGKAGYPKNLIMVSHNWYPSISEAEYNHQPKTCGLPFICPSNKPASPKPVCHRSPKCFQSPEAL